MFEVRFWSGGYWRYARFVGVESDEELASFIERVASEGVGASTRAAMVVEDNNWMLKEGRRKRNMKK